MGIAAMTAAATAAAAAFCFRALPLPNAPHGCAALRCSATPPSPPTQLLNVLSRREARVGNDAQIAKYIAELEARPAPDVSTAFLGTWRNVYTSLPSTASPIQRFVVANVSFAPAVEQVVLGKTLPHTIVNRVDLRGALGAILNIKADVYDTHRNRLFIRFVEAWFSFVRLPDWLGAREFSAVLRVPYPVPFALLGDIAKGWLDTTYIDSSVRVSRGNKQSVFVLVRSPSCSSFDSWRDDDDDDDSGGGGGV